MPPELPLLDLFNRLREHGLPLGVSEYQDVLRALRAGAGVECYEALARLCCTVWTTSTEEVVLFHRIYDQMLEILPASAPAAPEQREEQPPELNDSHTPVVSEASVPGLSHSSKAPSGPLMELDDPIQIVQAVRRSVSHDEDMPSPHFSLLTEYFPVTRRQMKQSWRRLRRLVRQGPPEVLDIRATVEKVSHEGVLLEPVLVPRRVNQAELVLLLDQDGSMVPFHILTRQLLQTLQRGGRLGQAGAYYFHDFPTGYLYRDATRVEAVQFDNALREIGERAFVLIVSDAGAARRTFDQERIDRTRVFVGHLIQSVRRCAWLNPMPRSRWSDTSAEQIAHHIPMFEMSRRGLDAAISKLRGVFMPGEKAHR
jgi:uncharacterized protein with von Willebrand factor type A (vWA) domain